MDARTRQIAVERIQVLFELANETFSQDPSLSQRYANLARRIAMAARMHLPRKYRQQICRHCKSFILAGANCVVRIQQRREPHVVMTCLNCGKHMRFPIRKRRGPYHE